MKIKKISQQNKDQSGIFQSTFETQVQNNQRNKESFEPSENKLYDVFKEMDESSASVDYPKHTLSTRYCADMHGVQAQRIGDGIYKNPITEKEYDYGEGFNLDGVDYPAYSVSMQTSLYSLSKKLKELGFEKYSEQILALTK
mgnify:CR=1 FL=1|tara:strand:+ start:166 stop:591 length:426 start_codon:yes stop_codon:yes gene_type:complete